MSENLGKYLVRKVFANTYIRKVAHPGPENLSKKGNLLQARFK